MNKRLKKSIHSKKPQDKELLKLTNLLKDIHTKYYQGYMDTTLILNEKKNILGGIKFYCVNDRLHKRIVHYGGRVVNQIRECSYVLVNKRLFKVECDNEEGDVIDGGDINVNGVEGSIGGDINVNGVDVSIIGDGNNRIGEDSSIDSNSIIANSNNIINKTSNSTSNNITNNTFNLYKDILRECKEHKVVVLDEKYINESVYRLEKINVSRFVLYDFSNDDELIEELLG